MRIFIAGGSGVIGRSLVPMLVGEGHRVTALTRSSEGATSLASMGAVAVMGDVFDVDALQSLVAKAEPDLVLHQLTAFGAKDGDPLAETIRVRTEGTRNLVQAARQAGVRRFVTQSISFICSPNGDGLTDAETPLYLDAPDAIRPLADAISELEGRTLGEPGMDGVVLRYGWFYGHGTNYDPDGPIPRSVRKGRAPIVGEGEGTYSYIGVDDAARATMLALGAARPGIYNIVDDDPARLSQWLPFLAELLGAPTPGRMEESAARQVLGDMLVYIMNEQRGASNAKARRELQWQPRVASWREGFQALYATAGGR